MQILRNELNQAFSKMFLQKIGLSETEFDLLLSHFFRGQVFRKNFYLQAGQITKQTAYINKGCMRTFTADEKGGEHILFFAFEDWWIGDMESYHTQKPGTTYIQAIEDCELLCITKIDMEKLELQIPKLKEWHSDKQRKSFHATLKRLSEVKSQSPEERYKQLLDKHPQIFQRIPLQYIASYLDIEAPSLSRLRKRLSYK
jgi:CRP-like cAMP-binding protein